MEKDDIKTANVKAAKISAGLDKLLQVVRKKYGLPSSPVGVPVNPVIKTFNTLASLKSLPELPEINARIPLPEFIQKALTQRGIVQTYRNILNDLPTIWKLGDVHKKLTQAIRKSDEPAFTPKTEALSFAMPTRSGKAQCESMPENMRATTCVLFDVSAMQAFNDANGWDAGDKLLVGIMSVLVKYFPATSEVTRFSGDEFLVVTADGNAEFSAKLARDASNEISDSFCMTITIWNRERCLGRRCKAVCYTCAI